MGSHDASRDATLHRPHGSFYFSFFHDLRCKRRGSVPAPVRLWLEKIHNKRPTKRRSALSSHVHTSKVRKNHPSDCGHHAPGRWQGLLPPSDLLNYTQNKEAHKRNEGTPSFRRRHTMFKLYQKSKDPDKPAQTQKDLSLTILLFLCFLSPHPSPSLSEPVHGERKACLLRQLTMPSGSGLTQHASLILGREAPLPCGSSRQLARAPNPAR